MKQTLQQTIVKAWEDHLVASRSSTSEVPHSEKVRKFYVSDMGKCLRMRYLKRKGIKGLYGAEAYYTFAHGDFIHNLIYKSFESAGILHSLEQKVETEHFSGRYDGKITYEGKTLMFDGKSTNPYVMKRIQAGAGDNRENIMQTLAYMMIDPEAKDLDDRGVVVYVNKLPSDKVCPTIILPKIYHLELYRKDIQEDMDTIVDYWNQDKIPPCTCPSWSTQRYNSFWQFCKMGEKDIKKHLDYIKAGKLVTSDGYTINVEDEENHQH